MTPTINPQGFYESREEYEEAMAAKRQEREAELLDLEHEEA